MGTMVTIYVYVTVLLHQLALERKSERLHLVEVLESVSFGAAVKKRRCVRCASPVRHFGAYAR